MREPQKTIHFGHFLRWRQENLGLTVKDFAERAGYSERHMLAVQRSYSTAGRLQGSKLLQIAKAAGYATIDELTDAWTTTPVPVPEFKEVRDDGKVNIRSRVTPETRAAIAAAAKKDGLAAEEVAGAVLDGAFSAGSVPDWSRSTAGQKTGRENVPVRAPLTTSWTDKSGNVTTEAEKPKGDAGKPKKRGGTAAI